MFSIVQKCRRALRARLTTKPTTECSATLVAAWLVLIGGCAQEMMNERRVESQEVTEAFADGVASQAIPQHAIAASETAMVSISVGQPTAGVPEVATSRADNDDGYWDGRVDGKLVDSVPRRVLAGRDLRGVILRGQQRFNISCAPCHDRTGSGNGMVARRGFKYPPSYHTDRLREQPLGYIFNVATNGRGDMPSYGDLVSTDDRWAIAAYVRTLQFSQYARRNDLEQSDLKALDDATAKKQTSLNKPTATRNADAKGQEPSVSQSPKKGNASAAGASPAKSEGNAP